MKTRTTLATALALTTALVLAGCSSDDSPGTQTGSEQPTTTTQTPNGNTDADLLAAHDLTGLDARQIIERLDTMPLSERPADLMASIRPDELILSDAEDNSLSLPMPSDEFYLSFAPYVDQTHDCYFHSLTTCTGELQKAEISVTITDSNSGQIIVDESMLTYDNGFAGVWLPRDIEAELTVSYDGLTASAPISTRQADDLTCLTTLQLT
ncbi:hypothetical protein SAMN06309944_2032 [Micrococcales bacterium KH10]|nr:hypothetical protein SAMN06309944_2032 [Micrococcales bacterium KH10]